MEPSPLTAVSPVDGRYASKTAALRPYFSEAALIRYRVRVEVEYFIALCSMPLPQLSDCPCSPEGLRAVYRDFSVADAARVKEIESVTNHDVKAVEYFLKERFASMGLEKWSEFIHFGLTSQDINNTAQPLMLKDAVEQVYLPALQEVVARIAGFEKEWADVNCGREILRVTLPCSFGQAVAVADGAVVAVEAMEGTDAMIERAGTLSGTGSVVKMMKNGQDLRYDLPTIGPATIEAMHKAGLTCLAVETGHTLIVDPDETLSRAGKYGIAVVGIKP